VRARETLDRLAALELTGDERRGLAEELASAEELRGRLGS
jgi:hypothetical protein